MLFVLLHLCNPTTRICDSLVCLYVCRCVTKILTLLATFAWVNRPKCRGYEGRSETGPFYGIGPKTPARSQDPKGLWIFSPIIFFSSSGKLNESLEQPGRRRRSKRRFSSLTNLTDLTATGKKASGGRRRRNSISLDDIQNLKRFLRTQGLDQVLIPFSLRSFRGSEDGRSGSNFPPSTFGTSKKFSQYTGTSPKEKIEWVHLLCK